MKVQVEIMGGMSEQEGLDARGFFRRKRASALGGHRRPLAFLCPKKLLLLVSYIFTDL